MEGSNGPESDADMIASLRAELAWFGVRELDLELRVAALENNRWSAFSLIELEWITSAFVEPSDGMGPDDELPRQANAELERRARADRGVERDEDEDVDLR